MAGTSVVESIEQYAIRIDPMTMLRHD